MCVSTNALDTIRLLLVPSSLLLLGLPALAIGCTFSPLSPCKSGQPGQVLQCPTPGYTDRAFALHLPANWDGSTALPLVYLFHGGLGNRGSADEATCSVSSPKACFVTNANARGYAVVIPDGTGFRPSRNLRTWNAGGGVDDWACVSGGACKSQQDDMAYLDTVFQEVENISNIDADHIFATGLSNGGAISHRFACERPGHIAGIAAVSGTNQYAAAGAACTGGAAILQIHGQDDPVWLYETSYGGSITPDNQRKLGALDSTLQWAQRNGCSDIVVDSALPDLEEDGTHSRKASWQDCQAPVELITVEGGGHTWPGGQSLLDGERVGAVSKDFKANDLILDFFDAAP